MIRAYIREDLAGMFLSIALIREQDGTPRQILRILEGGDPTTLRWEDLPDPPAPDVAPTLQLGDNEARALLEALARHYGGADDVRALRRDYDAERKRVDTLTSALTGVTLALSSADKAEPVFTAEQWRRIAGDL